MSVILDDDLTHALRSRGSWLHPHSECTKAESHPTAAVVNRDCEPRDSREDLLEALPRDNQSVDDEAKNVRRITQEQADPISITGMSSPRSLPSTRDQTTGGE